MDNLEKKLVYDVPGASLNEKRVFVHLLKHIAKRHRSYFAFPSDQKITAINVYGWDNRSEELKKYNALGLAFFDGRIHMVDLRNPRWNAQVWAMEHGHRVIMEVLPFKGYQDEANNLIHYAANAGSPYIEKKADLWFPSRMDAIFRRNGVWIDMQWYNLSLVMRDIRKMNREIADGTAPQNPHKYWTVNRDSLQADGIVHVCENDGHHTGGGGHHHGH